MADLVLIDDPEVGAGLAELVAAEPPTIRSNLDTYANEALPAQNFADRAKLVVNGGGATDARQAFLFFAMPFQPGDTVIEATLQLFTAEAWAGAQTVTAKRIVDPWKEQRLTWGKRPAVVATNSAATVVTDVPAGTLVEWDLTPMLGDVSGGAPFQGVRLELGSHVTRKFWSSENPAGELRPVLVLRWNSAPLPPSNLAPSGGRVISAAKPTLSWRHRDPENDDQAESRVQISTTEVFAAPEYDSGWVANTETQWPLSETAYAGLADADVRFWRVATRDEFGGESEWSDIESFERRTKGALTIVNPAVEPDNYVEELTPPLDFTFTGRTQKAARVDLYSLDALERPDEHLDRWQLGPDDSRVHVAKNTLRSGVGYRLIVDAWDDFHRQSMPGDPDFVRRQRDFTYQRSGVPSPVDSLVVADNGYGVTLTWDDPTQPDHYCVRVDGHEVEDGIDPEDVFVAGTTYSYPYARAEGNAVHTYEVERVVASAGKAKHSGPNPTVDFRLHVSGVWLVDDDLSIDGAVLAVQFITQQQSDLSIGESGTTYDLPYSRVPVRITDSMRGYEGHVGGVLNSVDMKDRFLKMKGRVGKTVRLIQHTLNIPVQLAEATGPSPRPAPAPEEQGARFDAGVDVYQVGEFPMKVRGG